METKNLFIMFAVAILLIGIVSAGDLGRDGSGIKPDPIGISPVKEIALPNGKLERVNQQPISEALVDKQIVKYDGSYINDEQVDDQVYVAKIEYQGKDKIYHIDSEIPELVNRTLEFYYNVQPDYIKHIQHSGNLENTYFPSQWLWTPDCSGDGEEQVCNGGWVTLDVQDIDYGLGSNTFPISTTGPTWARDGYFAGSFNGVNSYVQITNQTDFNWITNNSNISISFWINGNNFPSSASQVIINLQSGIGGFDNLDCGINNNEITLSCAFGNGTSGQYKGSKGTGNLSTNTWYHFVYVFDNVSQSGSVYLNNIISTSVGSGTGNGGEGKFYIGKKSSTGGYFNGSIDKVQIFNRSLSQAEITQLYNNGLTSPVCNLITNGQVLCIDFDDFSVQDKSGNGNNGVPTNLSYQEIQGNYRTLTEGVDYTLDKVSGLLTVINPNYVYNYILASWGYYTTNDNRFAINILDLIAGFIALIIFIIGAIYVIKSFSDKED